MDSNPTVMKYINRFSRLLLAAYFNIRTLVLGILLTISFLSNNSMALRSLDIATADSLAYRQVKYNGRVMPFSTFATRLTLKLTGRTSVGGLSPEAFVASLILYPEEWSYVKFLKVKNPELRSKLNGDDRYVAIGNLYDSEGKYIPGELFESNNGRLDKDILALDEKTALLVDLWNGQLFSPLPDNSLERRPDWDIRIEVLFNRLVPTRLLFFFSLLLGLGAFASIIMKHSWKIWPLTLFGTMVGICVFFLRWEMTGNCPLTNTYDLMEFLATSVLLLCLIPGMLGRMHLLEGIGLICGAILYLVAWIGSKDPVMTPLMPALASPWLAIHVSLIMLSYAILGFTLPVSIIAIFLKTDTKRLTDLSLRLLIPGNILLFAGIVMGSLWAKEAWGRYWAWDPKETAAALTLIIYSLPLLPEIRRKWPAKIIAIYLSLAFLSILLTYFGVNYLPSLHSYR